jgi:beta-lactamase class A
LVGLGTVVATGCAARSKSSPKEVTGRGERDEFGGLEAASGGRLGVFAVDTGSGCAIGHRQDERFAMCSTFKWVLAAAVLARVDRGELSLGERIHYEPSDVLEYAPVTREHVAEGSLSIEALARAAVVLSDNTAANLLLSKVAGPAGLTQFCRRLGDSVTRLDRDEPSLNATTVGDSRDTTSPRAMAFLMQTILCGSVLAADSRERLLSWLFACETGKARLRAGLPATWRVGDKTGTGDTAANDVAIAFPPGRSPILIASYLSECRAPIETLNAAHAEVARMAARRLLQFTNATPR